MQCTPTVFKNLPGVYKFDRDVVRAACLKDPMCIKYVSSYFILDDASLFQELVAVNGRCLFYATQRVKDVREVALAAVRCTGDAFQLLPMEWCDQWEFVAAALKSSPRMFKYASHRIQDDPVLALEAVRYAPEVFAEVSHRLANDFAFVLAAVRVHSRVLLYVLNDLISNNTQVTYSAICANPGIVFEAPQCRPLLRDSALLLQLVERDATVLQFAPEELRDDYLIGIAAVRQHASAYLHLSPRLRLRRDIVLATILNCSEYILDVPAPFLSDADVVYAAVSGYGANVQYVPAALITFELALVAVQSTGIALSFMPQWSGDLAVVRAAVQQNYAAIAYAAPHLARSRELVLDAVKLNWRTVKYMHADFRSDREIALCAVAQHGHAIRWLHFTSDPEIALLALKTSPKMFEELDEVLVTDEAFMLRAVRVAPVLLPRFPQTIPFLVAALAHSTTLFFGVVTTDDYEKVHTHLTRAVAAREEGRAFNGFKTALDAHGLYSRRLRRAVLEYVGYPGQTWPETRAAFANLLN